MRRYLQRLREERPRLSEDGRFRAALVRFGGVTEATVRNYLHESDERYLKLGQQTRVRLDVITRALGFPLPRGSREGAAQLVRQHHRTRVGLLTELDVPSESFHYAMIKTLVREAAEHGFLLSVHEVPDLRSSARVRRIVRHFRLDAVVSLRLTPSPDVLESLARRSLPLVLIHADRQAYPEPVIANIVPTFGDVGPELVRWMAVRRLESGGEPASAASHEQVVVITMPEEGAGGDFEELPGVGRSIRNDRRRAILDALADARPIVVEVPDYGFRHALRVYQQFPSAALYVALSDQIAVGLKLLLVAAGRSWHDRIVGYDDSPLARREGIPSFSQESDRTWREVVDVLSRVTGAELREPRAFREFPTPVHLEARSG